MIGACIAVIATSLVFMVIHDDTSNLTNGTIITGGNLGGGFGAGIQGPSNAVVAQVDQVVPLSNPGRTNVSQIAISQLYLGKIESAFETLAITDDVDSISASVAIGNLSDVIDTVHSTQLTRPVEGTDPPQYKTHYFLTEKELASLVDKSINYYNKVGKQLEDIVVPPNAETLDPENPNEFQELLNEYNKSLQGCSTSARFYRSLGTAQSNRFLVTGTSPKHDSLKDWNSNLKNSIRLQKQCLAGNKKYGDLSNELYESLSEQSKKSSQQAATWKNTKRVFLFILGGVAAILGFLYKGVAKIIEKPRDHYLRKIVFEKFPELERIVAEEEARAKK